MFPAVNSYIRLTRLINDVYPKKNGKKRDRINKMFS
jgi:hypothetical protein